MNKFKKYLLISMLICTVAPNLAISKTTEHNLQIEERKCKKDHSGININDGVDITINGKFHFQTYSANNATGYAIGQGNNIVNRLYKDITAGTVAIPSLLSPDNKYILVVNPMTLDNDSGGIAIKDHDAGVLGDYTANYDFLNESILEVKLSKNFNENIKYGGVLNFIFDTGRTKAMQAYETFIFLNTKFGNLEIGTVKGAEEKMKLDATSISAIDGGFNGDWFNFVNTEGSYIDAVYNSSEPIKSTRNRDARRPFHIMPLMYSEYSHKYISSLDKMGYSGARIYPLKISYYSSEAEDHAFVIGVSYTHDEGYLWNNWNITGNNEAYSNVVGMGINYNYINENLKMRFAFSTEHGSFKNDINNTGAKFHNLMGWNLGSVMSYHNFSIAGSFANIYKSGLSNKLILDNNLNTRAPDPTEVYPGDTKFWTLGFAYNNNVSCISVGYFESEKSAVYDYDNNIFSDYYFGYHHNLAYNKYRFSPYLAIHSYKTEEAANIKNPNMENNKGSIILVGVRVIM